MHTYLQRLLAKQAVQKFVQNFVLQALQSKALYGGKTTCKTTFCKPYKAYKASLCTSFVSFVRRLRSKALLWYFQNKGPTLFLDNTYKRPTF
ncbi:hypothetical protein EON73_00185 [bacterium]|nr:MAG: hypothetical protein EON73_00185 [bacterium]